MDRLERRHVSISTVVAMLLLLTAVLLLAQRVDGGGCLDGGEACDVVLPKADTPQL